MGGQFVPVRQKPRQRVQKHVADYSTRFQPRYHAGERPCYRCANSQHTLCRNGECTCDCVTGRTQMAAQVE